MDRDGLAGVGGCLRSEWEGHGRHARYIDYGPDSNGVIRLLLRPLRRCTLVPLKGDHEEMFFAALACQPGRRPLMASPRGRSGGAADGRITSAAFRGACLRSWGTPPRQGNELLSPMIDGAAYLWRRKLAAKCPSFY